MFNNTAENILWYILDFNKVEQVSINLIYDINVGGFVFPEYATNITSVFSILPKFKHPLFYEKVYAPYGFRARLGTSRPGLREVAQYSFLDLVYNISKDAIFSENKWMSHWNNDSVDGEPLVDLIVTFFTKNKRITVDEVQI